MVLITILTGANLNQLITAGPHIVRITWGSCDFALFLVTKLLRNEVCRLLNVVQWYRRWLTTPAHYYHNKFSQRTLCVVRSVFSTGWVQTDGTRDFPKDPRCHVKTKLFNFWQTLFLDVCKDWMAHPKCQWNLVVIRLEKELGLIVLHSLRRQW